MNKKKTTDGKVEEILNSFPGKLAKGSRGRYVFTDEQLEWIRKNVGKKYTYSNILHALGISWSPLLRALGENDPKKMEMYNERIEKKLRMNKERRQKAKAKKKKVWLWDIDEALRKSEIKRQEEEARREALKAEKEDAAISRECYKKLKDRVRTPIPFTIDEQVLRQKAYDSYYILPDGKELFTERRRCIYWDEKTKRSEKIEQEADRLKFNVIEYRRMFPNMGNRLSSCSASSDIYR